jgi:hypothetical protein
MENIFDTLFLGQSMGEQMSTLNISEPPYNLGGALEEWQNEHVLPDTDFSGSAPFSSQEALQLSSLSPGSTSTGASPISSQEASHLSSPSPSSTSEDVIMLNDQDEICYGMVSKRDYPPR